MVDYRRVDDCAIAGAAGDDGGAFGLGVGNQFVHAFRRGEIDQRAKHDMAARIAARQAGGALGELGDEIVGDLLVDDDALSRHADLALIGESAEYRRIDRGVHVGVGKHDERRFAAEFKQHRLQVLGAEFGDLLADPRRAREVDPLDGRIGDQRPDDLRRILRRVRDEVDDALRESRFVHHLNDQAVGLRADLGRAQDRGVAAGERRGDRPHAKDHRRVPRRDAKTDSSGLANRERHHARLIGGNDLARNLRRQGRRLAQQTRSEMHVEAAPRAGRADFLGHRFREIVHAPFEKVGRLEQQGAPRPRPRLGPCGKGAMRGRNHLGRVGLVGRGGLARHRAGHGILADESRPGRRPDGGAVDDEVNAHHNPPYFAGPPSSDRIGTLA